MIIHRAIRDIQRCRKKYGKAWEEYERQVPYLFIPVSLDMSRLHEDFTNSLSVRILIMYEEFAHSGSDCLKRKGHATSKSSSAVDPQQLQVTFKQWA